MTDAAAIMPKTIPLEGRNVSGAGFLVTDGQRTWLMTALHLITGTGRTPEDSPLFRGVDLKIVGIDMSIPLYSAGGSQRFNVIYHSVYKHYLDVVAVPLTQDNSWINFKYGNYHADSIGTVAIGDTVEMSGFPASSQTSGNATILEATVIEMVGSSLSFDKPSMKGMSGGPVTIAGKLVGISHGDKGSDEQLTNGVAFSLSKLATDLFF